MLKQAFADGVRDALARHGLLPEEEKSTLQKALPWMAAAGAGLGAYKLLRTPSFSSNPALRKIQERASAKGFHRIVDVSPDPGGSWLRPTADAEGRMSPWNKLKLFLSEGTTEAIPTTHIDDVSRLVGRKGPIHVDGVTHGRHDIYGRSNLVRGGIDIEGPEQTMRAMNRVSSRGKRFEANLLQKYAPGSMPETHTDIRSLFEGLPADRTQAAAELQRRMLETHGMDVLLKPNHGLASGGKFPRASQNWSELLENYDAHMADPVKRKAFRAMRETGGNELSKYLIENGLYEGSVLHGALRNPKSVVAQRLIDGPLGEYRVHTIAGDAPSQLTIPRFARDAKDKAKAMPAFFSRHKDMRAFVKDTIRKLPPKYRKGNYAFDVMPHRRPDGTIGYQILEMNPTEQAVEGVAGGGSGFYDVPYTGHLHYRAATGRHTPLLAGLGAMGAAGAAGLGTRALVDDDDER